MKEIVLEGLDTSIYYEKLKNGLEVFLCPIKNKNSYFVSYATKYGSDIVEFVPNGGKKKVRVPNGVAHFLEHKLFESDTGISPFAFFSSSGTEANAFTSFETTAYHCSGTKNYLKNLDFLIKYVNKPYFTDENVKKEVGIITEEINAALDNPDRLLREYLRKATYKKLPRKDNVLGSVKDIEKITKEDLYMCYSAYYQPSNMFIIATGNIDIEDTMKIIHQNFDDINSYTVPKRIEYNEDRKVAIEYKELKSNVSIPKVGIAIKCKREDFRVKDDRELFYYLNMFAQLVFGRSSNYYEEIVENNIALNFGTFSESVDGFETLYIYATTKEADKFIEIVNKYIDKKNIDIKAEDLERYKKIWIANLVRNYENVDSAFYIIFDDIIKYNKVINNRLQIIKKINLKTLNTIIEDMDLTNKAVIKVLPKK